MSGAENPSNINARVWASSPTMGQCDEAARERANAGKEMLGDIARFCNVSRWTIARLAL